MENYDHIKEEYKERSNRVDMVTSVIICMVVMVFTVFIGYLFKSYAPIKVVGGLYVAYYSSLGCELLSKKMNPYDSGRTMILRAFAWVVLFLLIICSSFYSMANLFL